MSVVYDAGVLVAADRGERRIWADHRARLEAGIAPVVTAPAVAQVSRSSRQANLRRLLRGCDIVAFEGSDSHAVGVLLAKSSMSDVVDAHVVLTASRRAGVVLTSDLNDLRGIAAHTRPRPEIRSIG